jgi:tRNA(fMet)-specific endonuclease VapC
MVILDTDHMSVLERREQPGVGNLRARLAEVPPSEVMTTVISYEEQMRGWMAYLARARSMAQQITAYGRLLSHLESYRRIPVLGFDEAAATVFQRLRHARIRMGVMDLKIASIVLSRNATLLSRNLGDFRQIPDLHVEDWTTSR